MLNADHQQFCDIKMAIMSARACVLYEQSSATIPVERLL
jgi:hypothetical protein